MEIRNDVIIEHHLYSQSFSDAKANYKSTSGTSDEDFADISRISIILLILFIYIVEM